MDVGWLPIIYYSRVESIPEYFVRRFGSSVRHIATSLILLYLLTGVSYNFFTLGVVGEQLFGIPVFAGLSGWALSSAPTSPSVGKLR